MLLPALGIQRRHQARRLPVLRVLPGPRAANQAALRNERVQAVEVESFGFSHDANSCTLRAVRTGQLTAVQLPSVNKQHTTL